MEWGLQFVEPSQLPDQELDYFGKLVTANTRMGVRGSKWSNPGTEQTVVPGEKKKRDICALRDHKSLWRKGNLGMCSSIFDCL